jgi:hypothetical protein
MSKPNDGSSSNLISVDCFGISPFMHTCYLLLSINVFDVCEILAGGKKSCQAEETPYLTTSLVCTLA